MVIRGLAQIGITFSLFALMPQARTVQVLIVVLLYLPSLLNSNRDGIQYQIYLYVDPGILIILRMAINIDPVTRFFFRHLHNVVLVV